MKFITIRKKILFKMHFSTIDIMFNKLKNLLVYNLGGWQMHESIWQTGKRHQMFHRTIKYSFEVGIQARLKEGRKKGRNHNKILRATRKIFRFRKDIQQTRFRWISSQSQIFNLEVVKISPLPQTSNVGRGMQGTNHTGVPKGTELRIQSCQVRQWLLK